MEIDDLSAVFHLGEQLFTSGESPLLYRTWDSYEVTQFYTTDPDYCLVADAGGTVVGFLLATTIEKEGTAWKKYGYMTWIGIQEAYQGRNIGKRLYRELEKRLRKKGVRMIMADTDGNNRGALRFLESQGFTLRGEHLWLSKTLSRTEGKALPPERISYPPS